MIELTQTLESLKAASSSLSWSRGEERQRALASIQEALGRESAAILAANEKDVRSARESGMKASLIDRLMLTEQRIEAMIAGIGKIITLADPLWQSKESFTLDNGLTVSRMSVPLGVIAIIYESRPNVTVDAAALALKSGNAILLRGSSSALASNRALVKAIKKGVAQSPISPQAVELVDSPDRALVEEMLGARDYLDLIIPRGGRDLINYVTQNSLVPTIETGVGNCHIYIDSSADLEMAVNIVENAKTQRPGVCNACETVLVHREAAARFLPALRERIGRQVELRGCKDTAAYIPCMAAGEEDWAEEYLDYILALRVVDSLEEAMEHIARYGTKHSEAIITENLANALKFQRQVDAAAVYVNASTRFTDGEQMGLGAEMGISTQKIHARGPMGLNQLVTSKLVATGSGQIRR